MWSHDGIICTGETYKAAVKLTFAKGASLEDPARLFNVSLDGTTPRLGGQLDVTALALELPVTRALTPSRQ